MACDVVVQITDQFATAFGDPVSRVHMGIRDALSLIYTVRDKLIRPEKQFTEQNEPARYSRVLVDRGERERRVLIHQGSLTAILRRIGNAGASLGEAFRCSFSGRDVAAFMNLRDGGFLRSSQPHICVFSSCSRPDAIAIPPSVRDLFLFAEGHLDSFFGDFDAGLKELNAVLPDCCVAAAEADGEIPLAPEALRAIQEEIRAFPQAARGMAAIKIIKIAQPWAVLDSCRSIDRPHVIAASEVVKESQRVLGECQESEDQAYVENIACTIEEGLCRDTGAGLSGSQINRVFGGNLKKGTLKRAKELLLRQGRATVTYIPTDGRPLERWRLGDPK